jgi:hypothetical protein
MAACARAPPLQLLWLQTVLLNLLLLLLLLLIWCCACKGCHGIW